MQPDSLLPGPMPVERDIDSPMRDEDQDAADIAQVVAGNIDAFEGIVLRWQHRLVSLAWRFCRNRTQAEDMAQEVFLKAFRSCTSFRGDSTFSTWLISIAVNTYRTKRRSERPQLPDLDLARLVATGPGVQQTLEESQLAESVRRTVLALPERYREAIVLFYFEEKDLAETALALGIPEGTLKARLHRGRELLRRRCANLSSRPLDMEHV